MGREDREVGRGGVLDIVVHADARRNATSVLELKTRHAMLELKLGKKMSVGSALRPRDVFFAGGAINERDAPWVRRLTCHGRVLPAHVRVHSCAEALSLGFPQPGVYAGDYGDTHARTRAHTRARAAQPPPATRPAQRPVAPHRSGRRPQRAPPLNTHMLARGVAAGAHYGAYNVESVLLRYVGTPPLLQSPVASDTARGGRRRKGAGRGEAGAGAAPHPCLTTRRGCV